MRISIPMTWPAVLLVLALGLLAAPGAAGGEPACTCRYGGKDYAQEACVCIKTSEGPRLACCGKVLNNASWTFSEKSCPLATAPAPDPGPSLAEGSQPPGGV